MSASAPLVRAVALAAGLSCLVPAASRAEEAPTAVAAAVDGAIRPLLREHDIPGMAVAVTVGGRQHVFAYGVASRDSKAPVTADTLFEIGSLSKTFTATLAAYGQALGELSLDDHPSRFLPALRGSAVDRASLLELGTFTAGGLPLQVPDAVKTDAEMVSYFRAWTPDAAPGTQRRYSNPSIGLFGHLAAKAMGGDFADLLEARLFPRLGLRRTYIRVPKEAMASYAWGYAKANTPIRVNPGLFDAEAYGVKSTAADMIRFIEANIRPEGLEPPLRRAVEATQVGRFRVEGMVQGLGWEQYPYPVALDRLQSGNATRIIMEPNPATRLSPPQAPAGPTLFNKTGSTNGFGAYVAFVPAKRIGIIMLANRNFPIPARVAAAHAVLERLEAQAP